jgi:hypothetical protein
MVVAKAVTAVTVSAALLGLAGCASTRGNVNNAADNLEYTSNTLARDAQADAARTDHAPLYERDARALAADARELRGAVDERGGDADVRAAFDQVSRSYHAVRDEVADSGDLQAQRDFAAVTDSYRHLEHDLNVPDRDREARADYPLPPPPPLPPPAPY